MCALLTHVKDTDKVFFIEYEDDTINDFTKSVEYYNGKEVVIDDFYRKDKEFKHFSTFPILIEDDEECRQINGFPDVPINQLYFSVIDIETYGEEKGFCNKCKQHVCGGNGIWFNGNAYNIGIQQLMSK
jgi:hypothetical protein